MAPWKSAGWRNRSEIEICADILRILATGPAPKTHIMYKANLAHPNCCAYLGLLVRADLVEKREATAAIQKIARGRCNSVYYLTPKGTAILQKLKSLEEIMELLDLKREEVALAQ